MIADGGLRCAARFWDGNVAETDNVWTQARQHGGREGRLWDAPLRTQRQQRRPDARIAANRGGASSAPTPNCTASTTEW